MVKLEVFSRIVLFGHMLKKLAHSFFDVWSFLLAHIQFTPKDFVNYYFSKKSDHENWTMKSDQLEKSSLKFHGLTSWSMAQNDSKVRLWRPMSDANYRMEQSHAAGNATMMVTDTHGPRALQSVSQSTCHRHLDIHYNTFAASNLSNLESDE